MAADIEKLDIAVGVHLNRFGLTLITWSRVFCNVLDDPNNTTIEWILLEALGLAWSDRSSQDRSVYNEIDGAVAETWISLFLIAANNAVRRANFFHAHGHIRWWPQRTIY